jgi:hypothetical protein
MSQEQRRERLITFVDIYHRRRLGDYDETYEDFHRTYIGPCDDDHCEACGESYDRHDGPDYDHPFAAAEGELSPIPRYASIVEDETYGMIHLFDDLNEAAAAQASAADNGEYLNVPCGVYDLDTGDQIEIKLVALTRKHLEALGRIIDDAYEYRRGDEACSIGDADEEDRKAWAEYSDVLKVLNKHFKN